MLLRIIVEKENGNESKCKVDSDCPHRGVGCGSVTVACIVYNGMLTYQQQKALVGACMLARENLTRYQSKVKELYGPVHE